MKGLRGLEKKIVDTALAWYLCRPENQLLKARRWAKLLDAISKLREYREP